VKKSAITGLAGVLGETALGIAPEESSDRVAERRVASPVTEVDGDFVNTACGVVAAEMRVLAVPYRGMLPAP
jgi:hypothetical protein